VSGTYSKGTREASEGRLTMKSFNCLLVGESGVGKTPLCATLEDCEHTSPCLFLDVDRGTMSIIAEPRPIVWEVTSWGQMQQVYTFVKNEQWDKLGELVGAEPREYKSIVVDSGTELEYILRKTIMSEDSTGSDVPEQRHYLKTQERFRSLYRAYRDLPLTLVMTAGVRDLKDDVASIIKYFPSFQPALTRDLVRMTDLIMFMDVRQDQEKKGWQRVLQTHPSGRIIARDRSQRLAPLITGEKLYFKDIIVKMGA